MVRVEYGECSSYSSVSVPTAPVNLAYSFVSIDPGQTARAVFTWEPPSDDGCSSDKQSGIIGYKVKCAAVTTSQQTVVWNEVNILDPNTRTFDPANAAYSLDPSAYVIYASDPKSKYLFKVAAITNYTNSLATNSAGVFSGLQTVTYMVFNETVKMRGVAVDNGYIDFYFTARTSDSGKYLQYQNSFWRLTNNGQQFQEGTDVNMLNAMLNKLTGGGKHENIYKNGIIDPSASGYSQGWPTDIITTSNGVSVVSSAVVTDFYGEALEVTFSLVPYGGYACWDVHSKNTGLDGIGSFMIQSDYTTDISFLNGDDQEVDSYEIADTGTAAYLTWTVNASYYYEQYRSQNENVPQGSAEFSIPVWTGDTLTTIKNRVDNGGTINGITCKGLQEQLFDFFANANVSTLPPEIMEIYTEGNQGGYPFIVSTEIVSETDTYLGKSVQVCHLKVNISTLTERVQNQISCRVSNVKCFYLKTKPNVYYVADQVTELRSFEDMYGRNKPGSSALAAGQNIVKRSYGFKFNLDYITEYEEEEASSIDMTPIPGTSSGQAIGLDMVGSTRSINISGVRVDNSNDWMFHSPFEYTDDPAAVNSGRKALSEGGVIYIGTSNWGWTKFMKAVMGTFQFIDGPYRLIIMTVPSSLMQQYFPDRYCKYQYPDGTYVVQVGSEDMCYVMIESFSTVKSEEMYNAIQYRLKLRRVVPMGSTI